MTDQITSLYHTHVALGGKMVSFAGYILPIQYETGVIKEHMAVRTAAGIFDVSHMGEILVTGEDAFNYIQELLTNDFTSLTDGRARYTLMCNEQGGTVDDLIVYQYQHNCYFIVVNASNKDKDLQWMKQHQTGRVKLTDLSDQISQIALQGPKALDILNKVMDQKYLPKKHNDVRFDAVIAGMRCAVARTGYTGEDGVELYLDHQDAATIWALLAEAGREVGKEVTKQAPQQSNQVFGLLPCGLGARDTLRLEASMPLYGHELSETITPLEAGLGAFVKMGKDFIGKRALRELGEPKRIRVGIRACERGIIRENMAIIADGEVIGQTTSGTYCPQVGYALAMGMVKTAYAQPGTQVLIDIRGRMTKAVIVAMPFYKRGER